MFVCFFYLQINVFAIYGALYMHTLYSEKNTPFCCLLYLCGKCLDFHKIFRE